MAAAYLKIWVGVGKEVTVLKALKALEAVKRADLTTGEQDIIALVERADYPSLMESILKEVRAIEGVERTVTNLVLD